MTNNPAFAKYAVCMAVIASFAFALAFSQASGDGWENPVIKNYGHVWPLPHAAFQPEKMKTYKAVFNITATAQRVDQPAPGLTHMGRTFNVFAIGGADLKKLELIAIIHGDATIYAMNDDFYRSQHGTANPNTQLFAELTKAGGKVYVCGQAMHDNNYPIDKIAPNVTLALSALAVLVESQDNGFALMPY